MWWRRDQEEEDPFASLREGSSGATASRSQRRDVADHSTLSGMPGGEDEPASDRVPGSTAPKRRRGSDRLLVIVFVMAALGASAALIANAEREMPADAGAAADADAPGDATPGNAGPGASDDRRANADRARAPRRYDLVRPAGTRRALVKLRRTMGPNEVLDTLRIASDRVNATIHSPRSERQRVISIADDLEVTATAAGRRDGRGMRLGQIDAAAPWRAARTAARNGGFRVGKLDYLAISAPIIPGAAPTWSAFFDGVRLRNSHWIASLDGRTAYRPGEQPASGSTTTGSSSVTVTRNGVRTTFSGADALRIQRCVQRAGNDGAAIQRCLP
jgi:hypothetical protein